MLDKIIDLGISRVEAEELINISENIEKDYKKLKKGYPIQYLIGYVNFYGHKIKINNEIKKTRENKSIKEIKPE